MEEILKEIAKTIINNNETKNLNKIINKENMKYIIDKDDDYNYNCIFNKYGKTIYYIEVSYYTEDDGYVADYYLCTDTLTEEEIKQIEQIINDITEEKCKQLREKYRQEREEEIKKLEAMRDLLLIYKELKEEVK